MKVCERCGDEICTPDGINRCESCEDESTDQPSKGSEAERVKRDRESALESCGLAKVRGALGGVYWE